MSIYVQYAPYTLAHGRPGTDAARRAPRLRAADARATTRRICRRSIVAQQVITPADLEETYGLTRRPHLSRRAVARSALHDAADPRLGAVPDTDSDLYLCGAGTHPGGGVTGGTGHNAAREIVKDLKRLRPIADRSRARRAVSDQIRVSPSARRRRGAGVLGVAQPPAPLGFTAAAATAHRALEDRFLALPSAEPHPRARIASSPTSRTSPAPPRDRELAEWTAARFARLASRTSVSRRTRSCSRIRKRCSVEMTAADGLVARVDARGAVPGDPHTAVAADPSASPTTRTRHRETSRHPSSTPAAATRPTTTGLLAQRHRRPRQDRARPLLVAVQLSRLQGADGAAARRRRHPHLLRSGGRRVREGARRIRTARGGRTATSSAAASSTTSSSPATR